MYLAIALIFIAESLYAQQFPSLEASPTSYELGRRVTTESSQWSDLAAAALWASAVNAGPGAEAKASAYLDRIKAAVQELAEADLPRDTGSRGEYVLSFMHRRFLKSYAEHQTRVDEIFISGKYNCVSSAVLYMILGVSVGLDVRGIMTKDHAFASVNTGAESIDVETTNRYGFDPGNRKEFIDAFGKTTGFAYTPAKNYRDRTAINRVELISLILSNRIAALEKDSRFAAAVPLALNRAAFLSANSPESEKQQADLMNALFNLGASLAKSGKEADAIAWAVYAGDRFPNPQRWQELIKNAAQNRLVKLVRAGQFSGAHSFLTEIKHKINGTDYRELKVMVLDSESVHKVNSIHNPGDAEAVLSFLAQNGEQLPPKRRDEMRAAAITAEVERLSKARNLTGAIQWVENALEAYGSNKMLETVLQTLRHNRISELHNKFAQLFNKKNYAQAKASIEKALQEFPGSPQLMKDLKLAEQALKQ